MSSLEVAELAAKAARYLPFVVYAILVVLSRTFLSEKSTRAGFLMGGAAALGIVGWLARYFLEQTAPTPTYDVVSSPGAILAVAAPTFIHDMAEAGALAIAFAAVVTLLPRERET
jgi:hypothetical protein